MATVTSTIMAPAADVYRTRLVRVTLVWVATLAALYTFQWFYTR